MENSIKRTAKRIFASRNKNITDLDSPDRFWEIRNTIKKKSALHYLYLEVYKKYLDCIKRSPSGKIVEIGSGAGFVKELIPNIITTDIVAYSGIDKTLDATKMDFLDCSLSCICMFNVLHHIPNTPAFFQEALRCLAPGGRLFMVEPYPGWIGALVYRYLHHEPYDPHVKQWEFESKGPVSDANNALPYVIFERDIKKFRLLFPDFSIERFETHTPLRYWLAGGLKKWSLLPSWVFNFATWVDRKLIQISPKFGSFVNIELVKR
ncbi:MAG: methyltransferase domain-containing protein [Gammaproteobacteria bacterium]|nr:methyltransferase domain-containing protein [Gammaproteobacteria bacterium]